MDVVTMRLLALAGPSARVPPRYLPRDGDDRPRRPRERARGHRRAGSGPTAAVPPRDGAGHRRGRYVVWGALSLVMVGIGGAAFGMGGGTGGGGAQLPRVTPQLVEFDLQHAINAGDVPFAEPSGAPAADPAKTGKRTPVEATTP
jgi:hypothetical protein